MKRSKATRQTLAMVAMLLLGYAAAPAAAAGNVAVFNFQMKSDTPEWVWLEKGLADRIATDFVQGRSVTVIARDRMELVAQQVRWQAEMADRDERQMQQVKGQLQIEQLVSGVYSVAGGRITITAQVLDVGTRQEQFRKEISGPADDVLNLQRQLSAELLAHFSGKRAGDILKALPVWTTSLPATRAMYEGLDLYDQGRYPEAWLKFRQASKQDAAYAEAQYFVGKMYYFMDRYEHARRALEKFVYLNNTHPRMGDAIREYIHTYEKSDCPPEQLLAMYEDFERRFPDVVVANYPMQDYLPAWLKPKKIALLGLAGRYEDAVKMGGPEIVGGWSPMERQMAALLNAASSRVLEPSELVQRPNVWNESSQLVTFTPGSLEKELLLNKPGEPEWIVGPDKVGTDEEAALSNAHTESDWLLEAPSGYVFQSLRIRPLTDGTDLNQTVSLSGIAGLRGELGTKVSALTKASGEISWEKLPRQGYLTLNWKIVVRRRETPRTPVRGIRVNVTLEKVGPSGQAEIYCPQTDDVNVEVDGVLTRRHGGVAGLLSEGLHSIRVTPVDPLSAYDAGETTVQIHAGKMSRAICELAWKKGSPWSSIRSGGLNEPSAVLNNDDDSPPSVQADEEAIRVIWSDQHNVWSSVSSDGVAFQKPRLLVLPVSTAWQQTQPRVIRDESGRFVMVFLSDRNAQHKLTPYICWSRDFVHWSAPSQVEDMSTNMIDFLQDNRGQLLLAECNYRTLRVLASQDGVQWKVLWEASPRLEERTEGIRRIKLFQRDDGRYELMVLINKSGESGVQRVWQTDAEGRKVTMHVDMKPPVPPRVRVLRYLSADGMSWGESLAYCHENEEARALFVIRQGGRDIACVACPGPGLRDSERSLWRFSGDGADGKREETGSFSGLIGGPGDAAWSPRWGSVVVWRNPQGRVHFLRGDLPGAIGPMTPAKFTGMDAPIVPPPTPPPQAPGEITYHALVSDIWNPLAKESGWPWLFNHPLWHVKEESEFSAPGPGPGLRSARALVMSPKEGPIRLKAALDAADSSAIDLNVLRVDFSGKGDFTNALVLKRTAVEYYRENGSWHQFHEGQAVIKWQGNEIPVAVWGQYIRQGGKGDLGLAYQFYVVSDVEFGKRVHRVRFFASHGDPEFMNPNRPELQDGKVVGVAKPITVMQVALDNGQSVWGFIGNPVFVDGEYYQLLLADQGRKMVATPLEGKPGWLRIDHAEWRVCLVSKERALLLTGGKDPVPVPPGDYTAFMFAETCRGAGGFEIWGNDDNEFGRYYEGPPVAHYSGKIEEDRTLALAIGSPFPGEIKTRQIEGSLEISLVFQDRLGNRMEMLRCAAEKPLPGPTFNLLDSQGKVVRKFVSSEDMAYYHSYWPIPPQYKGATFTLTVSDDGPFPITAKSVQVKIN